MLSSLLAAYLACGVPSIINKTNIWTEGDQVVLDTAKQRCREKYPEAPCLSTFIKQEELVYWSICGREK